MASARIARFATEAAPPQFVTVMRQRASKMLDTIPEEDSRDGVSDSFSSVAPKNASFLHPSVTKRSALQVATHSSSPRTMPPKFTFQAIKTKVSTFRR